MSFVRGAMSCSVETQCRNQLLPYLLRSLLGRDCHLRTLALIPALSAAQACSSFHPACPAPSSPPIRSTPQRSLFRAKSKRVSIPLDATQNGVHLAPPSLLKSSSPPLPAPRCLPQLHSLASTPSSSLTYCPQHSTSPSGSPSTLRSSPSQCLLQKPLSSSLPPQPIDRKRSGMERSEGGGDGPGTPVRRRGRGRRIGA